MMLCSLLEAAPKNYDFKDPKGVNAISVFLDSELEPIFAMAKDLEGTLSFDPMAPEKTMGKISFPISSLEFSNAKMTKIASGQGWLDAKSFGEVSFEISEVKEVTKKGEAVHLKTSGKLLLKGMSLPLETTLILAHVADGAKKRGAAESGDLLVLRSDFSIMRDAYEIKPGENLEKVGNEIQIKVAIAGYEKN